LKNILILYKPFLAFLLKFFVTYVVLGFVYLTYLNQYDATNNEPDGITALVTIQTVKTIQFFGYECEAKPHETEASFKILINNNYVARIVEGCNAISVIILFVAFVVAFKGRLKTTLCFILVSVFLIHFLNLTRIALICIAMLHYPKYQHLLHDVLFPLFIYGVVFVLWVVWVNKFSVYATKTS
jgi:exosortase family protein XrtF